MDVRSKIRWYQIKRYASVRCKDTLPSDAKIRFWVLIWPCRLDAVTVGCEDHWNAVTVGCGDLLGRLVDDAGEACG